MWVHKAQKQVEMLLSDTGSTFSHLFRESDFKCLVLAGLIAATDILSFQDKVRKQVAVSCNNCLRLPTGHPGIYGTYMELSIELQLLWAMLLQLVFVVSGTGGTIAEH